MSRRRRLRLAPLLTACACSLTWLALAAPLAAQRTLEIRSFDAELYVAKSGALNVRETITVSFMGEWNGLYRTIPVRYRSPRGYDYQLRVRVRSVRDDAGNDLRHELSREGADLKIKAWVPGARDAVRTIVLEYRVENGLRFSEEADELYWNVTGDRWDYPILAASADIQLPTEAAGLRTNVFTGAYGAIEQNATVETIGTLVRVRTDQELGLHEGLTVAVAWNAGVIERPGTLARLGDFLQSNLLLLLPLLAFVGMYSLWSRYGRDPVLGPIMPQYEPPAHMTPAEAGTLLDLRVDMRDVTATLVDLAVRGYLRIDETERERLFGLLNTRDYEFVLLRPRSEHHDLKEHERDLLDSLFEDGDTVALSSLQNRFYKKLPEVTDSLRKSLVADGYYVHNPNTVRVLYLLGAAAAGFAVHLLGQWLALHRGMSGLTGTVAGVLTGLVMALIGWQMPARTVKGTRALRNVRGFREFLDRVESDRFERMIDRPELFEQYLPFAMAFGVEKRWAAAFEGIYREPPQWYHGRHGGPFHTGVFVSDLNRMSAATGSTLQSSPRGSSSGSSGFGGGGFSGGGFGGGGGGGF